VAQENPSWGYDRIVGALANLGHSVSDQTVGNILKRHGIAPAPQRKHTTRWRDSIRAHMEVLAATDFFVEVFTLKGLATYYVLFFIQLETRRVCLAGITRYPDQQWMEQQARKITMKDWGFLAHSRYLLHDRDGKFCPVFREVIQAGKVKPLKLPARSPNLNAFAEHWVRSVKEECLSRLIFFGEHSLRQRPNGVYRAFPQRTESSGQREQASVSRTARTSPTLPPGECAMQRTNRWLTAVLRVPSSMNTASDY
jgi:hypothetical protein